MSNSRNEVGDTALTWAAQGGHLAIVRFLVSEGADIHVRDENGWTALMKAAVSGYLDVVRFLVDRGGGCSIPEMRSAIRP